MKLFEPQTLIIILVIALIIFGPKQLPALGKMFGKTAKGIRDGMASTEEEIVETKKTVSKLAEPARPAAEEVAESTPAEPVENPTEA